MDESPLLEYLLYSGDLLHGGKWSGDLETGGAVLTGSQIAFIIPLGAKPQQCYNDITPNDMYSNLSCAFSGSFLLFGGWLVIMWSMSAGSDERRARHR